MLKLLQHAALQRNKERYFPAIKKDVEYKVLTLLHAYLTMKKYIYD
ncbi:hypothetical protein [Photobacterium piscicola]|nr:hypothetical protein [Photobacterium piscicola]MEC6906389.1 hypothetical protein [Photobacterium piscicola]